MKNYLTMGGIALAVVVIWGSFFAPVQNSINETTHVGSVASPDINSPYYSVGGVRTWKQHSGVLNQASTTICSIQSPVSTSTLVYADLQLTTGTTTTILIDLAKDNTFAATTTKIGSSYTVTGGAYATIVGSTTPSTSAGSDSLLFSPGQYFNVKYGGAQGSLNVLAGSCNAVWMEN